VLETLADLRGAGIDIVTIGQYLRPSEKHLPVDRWVEPSTFDRWAEHARSLGFAYAACGPLVRSSYKAAEVFVRSVLLPGDAEGAGALLRARVADAEARAHLVPAHLVPAQNLVRRSP
jgi:lipoic acid synthetase